MVVNGTLAFALVNPIDLTTSPPIAPSMKPKMCSMRHRTLDYLRLFSFCSSDRGLMALLVVVVPPKVISLAFLDLLVLKRLLKCGTEHLEVNHLLDPVQRVAHAVHRVTRLVFLEEKVAALHLPVSDLASHPYCLQI